MLFLITELSLFLSTLSLRRATGGRHPHLFNVRHFYPRSPCGERPYIPQGLALGIEISIHALLAESDLLKTFICNSTDISIHALLAESDNFAVRFFIGKPKFLSTLSLRRATGWPSSASFQRAAFLSTLSLRRATGRAGRPPARLPDFYPRSPCGERRENADKITRRYQYFYPRSPCGERRKLQDYATTATVFLSTLSLRRATSPSGSRYSQRGYFYPRSPCGERPFLVTT